ncbi:MAG: ribonuclease HI [Trichocoleus desertorum ATA4-8-CV12]|jgi:ribonuclease HI|nr:ribonuclease HI [Trichocoleus desertorum ATA4-8-CV12]
MSDSAKIQSIYTDGACSGNPGPGGWGVVAYFSDGSMQELGGRAAATTNNRMEMQAAIAALEFLATTQQTEPISLYTDSEYVKNGVTKWVVGWKKKGWKTAQGKAVLNQDLWQTLDELNSKQVEWRYVRGHAGDVGNERCDVIARSFSLGKPVALKQRSPQTSNAHDASHNAKDRQLALVTTTAPGLPTTTTSESDTTDIASPNTVQSSVNLAELSTMDVTMTDSIAPAPVENLDNLPREVRVAQLRNLIETLRISDEIAKQGYLISSSELADLMDVNASAVTSRGDNWVWRNWVVSRVRREGNQILWQLERVD